MPKRKPGRKPQPKLLPREPLAEEPPKELALSKEAGEVYRHLARRLHAEGFAGQADARTVALAATSAAQVPAVNPVEAIRQNLQLALYESITGSDVVQLVNALKAKAIKGDIQATKLLLGLITQPGPAVQQVAVIAPPVEPTTAPPGTPERIAVYEKRAAEGKGIFHPDDVKTHGSLE